MDNNIIFRQGLKKFTVNDLGHLHKVVKRLPSFSRNERAKTLCKHLNWHSPSGAPKLPWVQISHLTSHALAQLTRCVAKAIVVKPLNRRFRSLSCSEQRQGRIIK